MAIALTSVGHSVTKDELWSNKDPRHQSHLLAVVRCNLQKIIFQNMTNKVSITVRHKTELMKTLFKVPGEIFICFSIHPSICATLDNEFSGCRGFPGTVGHQTGVHASVLWARVANFQEMHSWSLKHVKVIRLLDLLLSLKGETQWINKLWLKLWFQILFNCISPYTTAPVAGVVLWSWLRICRSVPLWDTGEKV